MHSALARWIDIAHHDDDRGSLSVLEERAFPFEVKRIFYMYRVPDGAERGGHAHMYEQQCLVTLAGSFALDVSDGATTETFVLDNPNRALYVPPMRWVRLHRFQPGTVVLVICDTVYDPEHVVSNWDEFRRLTHATSQTT